MIRLYIPSGTFVAFYPVQHSLGRQATILPTASYGTFAAFYPVQYYSLAQLTPILPMASSLRSLGGCCQDSGEEDVPEKNWCHKIDQLIHLHEKDQVKAMT